MNDIVLLMNENQSSAGKKLSSEHGFYSKHTMSKGEEKTLLFKQNGFTACDRTANALMHNGSGAELDAMVMENVTVPYLVSRNIDPKSMGQDAVAAVAAYDKNTVDAEYVIVGENGNQAPMSTMKLLPPGSTK